MSPKAWYENVADLADLWRWMVEDGNCGTPVDPMRYLDEPWHWEPEWNQYLVAEQNGVSE